MKILRSIALVLLVVSFTATSHAEGTPAGTTVDNRAQVTAQIDGATITRESNLATFTVDEILDLTLTWQDSASVLAQPGDPDSLLTYLLTNTGNGSESFLLEVDNAITGDDFNPESPVIYLDSNGNGTYDPGTDLPYDVITNVPLLSEDEQIFIFVTNAIPVSASDGNTGTSRLTATAATGSGGPGTVFPPIPPETIYSIVGDSGGKANADGRYLISLTDVVLTKSSQVSDPDGGSEAIVGATITYSMLVEVTGSRTATALVISDLIPTYTTYVLESLRLTTGGAVKILTDVNDIDEGTLIEDPPGSGNYKVEFSLGDLNNTNRTVTFQVTIN